MVRRAQAVARAITETIMTDRTTRTIRNRERSPAALLAKKAEFGALLAELRQASEDHFGADPDTVLWGEAAWRPGVPRLAQRLRGDGMNMAVRTPAPRLAVGLY